MKKTKVDTKSNHVVFNWQLGAILLFVFFVFTPVIQADFLTNWDDDGYIIQNIDIQSFSLENISKIFSSYYKSNYQPLSMLTYMLEFSFFQLNPAVYHTTNLLLHLLNTFLVFVFFQKLTQHKHISLLVALFFGIHTMHVESVAWIAERKDVLYSVFYLLSMIFYLNYLDNTNDKKKYGYSLLFFLMSCLSKPMAVTLPLVLLLLDYFKNRTWSLNVVLEKMPFFLISLVFGIVTLYSQSGQAMGIAPEFGFVNRFFVVCYGVFFYIQKFFLPTNLSAIHYYPPVDETLPILYFIAPLVLIGLLLIIWRSKQYRKELVFGSLFFVLTISIVLQIIPVGHAFASERYTYIPYLGLFYVFAFFITKSFELPSLGSFKVPLILIGISCVLLWSFQTHQRSKVWKNSVILFTDVVEKYPQVAHAYWMRGNVYKEYKQHQLAISDYDKAIELNPKFAKAYFNRAGSKSSLNQHQLAIDDYNKSIEADSLYAPAWNNRGNSFANLGQVEKAIENYQKAIEVDANFVVSYKSMGDILVNTKSFEEALPYYQKALIINPKYVDAQHGMGIAFYNSGKIKEACEQWSLAAQGGMAASNEFIQKYCK
jgi:protein O-mannosyl-transferase